jgi:phage tail sheath gpL-like
MIPFKNIPANIRVPLFYAEVDNSQANSGQINQRALIIGQITSAGTAVPNVPVISQGASDAVTAGGAGSMLALMTAAYRLNDTFGEVWYLPLSDAEAGVAATGSINFTSAATAAGALNLYIGGTRVTQPIATTQTTAQLATALAALINATPNLPVTAAVDQATTTQVNITAINKGPGGNDIDLRLNYQGTLGGEVTPTSLALTITQMSAGATAPDMTTALGNLGSQTFDFIACPYTDTTSLDAVKSLLNDTTGRWAWNQQLYGGFFAANRGTLSAQTTLGVTRNDQHGSIMGFYDSPTPNWIWSAALTGASAVSLRTDPALPLQTIALQGVLAPPLASRFQLTDQNTLLYDGISTFDVADDGTVSIQNLITTYQKNAFGNADDSYLQVETMFTLAYVLRQLKTLVTSKYARVKLAENGTRFATGSAIVTPNIIRADLIAKYREMEFDGYVQNGDAFKEGLIVEKNSQNPNRVDVLFPGILINQLRIFALLNQFRLS